MALPAQFWAEVEPEPTRLSIIGYNGDEGWITTAGPVEKGSRYVILTDTDLNGVYLVEEVTPYQPQSRIMGERFRCKIRLLYKP